MPLIVQSHVTNLTPGMERSTLASAGRSAETNGDRMARGLPGRCVRGRFKRLIRPEACAAEYLFNEPDCVRDGGCSTGRIMADRYKREVMERNLGFCSHPDCPSKGEEVLIKCAGMCATCYRMDLAARKGKKPAARVSPILAPEEVAAMSTALSASGRDESPEKAQESSENRVAAGQDVSKPVSAQDVTCHDPAAEAAALDAVAGLDSPTPAAGQYHFFQPENKVDLTRPFSFAGFEFDPGTPPPPPGRPIARLSPSGNISFSSAATQAHNLKRFQYVRVIPDKTGNALALIFLAEKAGGARKLGTERKSGTSLKASAEAVARVAPGLVGKPLELKPMGQDGAFVAVAVAVEEAGEVAA